MNDLLGDSAIQNLFMLFVATNFAIIFWFLEAVWRENKSAAISIFFFQALILFFIFKYWEKNRFKYFIAALFMIIVILIGAVTRYSFITRLMALLQLVSIWPYHAYKYILNFAYI